MPSGLFVSDCSSSDWAWLDLGCTVQNVGTDVGSAVTSALEPVWWILGIVAVLLVVVLLILGFAPNVKHIIPHIGFV